MPIINLYYITDHGNGSYVEGYEGDNIYNPKTCIKVSKKPTDGGYVWNNTTKVWELTIDSQQLYIRGLRNPELDRTDKYMLSDYPLTEEEKEGAITYRQKLREAPDKATPQEMVMPECPPYLKFKP